MTNVGNPINRILNLLKLERHEIISIYIYSILSGFIQLSLPIGIQAIIGFVPGGVLRASLVVLIILVVLGVLITGMLQINQMKIIEKIQQKIFVRYSMAFASQIPKLDIQKNDQVYLPEVINRFFDLPILQKSISKLLLDIPAAVIQIVFGLLLLSFYHASFVLFGVLLVTILVIIVRFTGGQGLATSILKSKYKYRVAAWLEEMSRSILSVKQSAVFGMHLRRADKLVSYYLDARNQHFKILIFQFNVLVVFKTVIIAALLSIGTYLMINQQITIGQFIAADIVILLVLNSVEKLIISLSSVYDTLTAVEKLGEITDKPVEKEGSFLRDFNNKGLKIEFKNLTFSYSPAKSLLKDINLSIEPNEKVCIQGEDGVGKTTILKLIAGFFHQFDGSILIDGIPIGNYNMHSLRKKIALVLSQQDIFQGSLWENITLGNADIKSSTIVDWAEKTGLKDYISTLQDGYDTQIDPTGNKLPNTVIQKILLVRALAQNPACILIDSSWLQFKGELKNVIDHLMNLKNTTVVFVSDDEYIRAVCDKTVSIDPNGTINTL